MPSLERITIRGFRSIASLEQFELRRLNVLIGANGAGKSNFLDFFAFLRAMCGFSLPNLPVSGLANFVAVHGGSERLLFNGSRTTQSIDVCLESTSDSSPFSSPFSYSFSLLPTVDEELVLSRPSREVSAEGNPLPDTRASAQGVGREDFGDAQSPLCKAIASWQIFHFHVTDLVSPMRKSSAVSDTAYLRPDGSNLAAFLLHLRETAPRNFERIVHAVRMVAPCVDQLDFKTVFTDRVQLTWKQKHSDYVLGAHQLSDGTVRYLALATAFLQPDPPSLMLVDEPELGLHPQALTFLAAMIQALPQTTQVVLATQSAALLDHFSPQDVVVVRREKGASTFVRLEDNAYAAWLADYSLGALWRKNVLEAGPVYEQDPASAPSSRATCSDCPLSP